MNGVEWSGTITLILNNQAHTTIYYIPYLQTPYCLSGHTFQTLQQKKSFIQ